MKVRLSTAGMRKPLLFAAGLLAVAVFFARVVQVGPPARVGSSSATTTAALRSVSSPTVTNATGALPSSTPDLPVAARVGALAPDFTLSTYDTNEDVNLYSLRGHPVWINFWASWCNPCVEEMPNIKDAYEANKASGLRVLGVDLLEDRDTIRKFVQRGSYSWTFLLDWEGNEPTAAHRFGVEGIPVHLFLDRSGVIRTMIIGGVTPGAIDAALKSIQAKQ